MSQAVEIERNQNNRESGVVVEVDKFRVWVKTWAEIIDAAEHRLKFVQKALDYAPSTEDALNYLRATHEKYLPENLLDDADAPRPG